MRRLASLEGQAGQNLILVAIGMTVFIGFVGLALDGGVAYLQQRGLQRAAEMASLAAASSYYRSNYAGNNGGYPHSVSSGVTDARAAAAAVVAADGYAASVMATPTLLDVQGNALAQQCNPSPCPGSADVRGFGVSLSDVAKTDFLRVVGIDQAAIAAAARAGITNPGGATREGPLLLQNFSDAGNNLPRFSAYPAPCAGAPGDGIQYAPVPDDCRPNVFRTTSCSAAPAPLALLPADETVIPPLATAFACSPSAPFTRFNILHDLPTCATLSCAATNNTVHFGETALLLTCPPSTPTSPCASPQYFMALDHTGTATAVVGGMNSRISDALAGSWAQQDCSRPRGAAGVPPLTPDNPRLTRLPISYTAPSTVSPNVGQARISETVVFCVQYTSPATPIPPAAGDDYFVPGYLVNESDLSATAGPNPGQYLGQDVLIRLIP